MGRADSRYFDGVRWTSQVGRAGELADDPIDADPPGHQGAGPGAGDTPGSAGGVAGGAVGEDPRIRKFGIAMAAVGAGIVVTSFLPWASGRAGSMSGFSWGPGRVTAVGGLLVAAYGAQVLVPERRRVAFSGWALTVLIACLLVVLASQAVVDSLDSITLGTGVVEVGNGLLLCLLLVLAAGWPLAVLWKDDRKRVVFQKYDQVHGTAGGR